MTCMIGLLSESSSPLKISRQVPIRLRFVPPWLELAIFQTAAIEHVSNAENGEQLCEEGPA